MANHFENAELMKSQTWGCEIEFSHLQRRKAISIVAKELGIDTSECVHAGNVNGLDTYYVMEGNKKWKVVSDSSVTGSYDGNGGELVTPIMTYNDIEKLQRIARALREAGAKSNRADYGCGVHIHVGADIGQIGGHNPRTLRNLANLVYKHEKLIAKACGCVNTAYCEFTDTDWIKALNSQRPRTMDQLEILWYQMNYRRSITTISQASSCADDHYNSSRYHVLNYHAIFQKGTIEFRVFQFNKGIHAGELKAYIQLCLALSNYAKIVRNCQPVCNESPNEKYAMRSFLNNMGFITDEFKTARKMLSKRLVGDTAYAGGRVRANNADLDDAFMDSFLVEGC